MKVFIKFYNKQTLNKTKIKTTQISVYVHVHMCAGLCEDEGGKRMIKNQINFNEGKEKKKLNASIGFRVLQNSFWLWRKKMPWSLGLRPDGVSPALEESHCFISQGGVLQTPL